jgi:cysteine dioxygenase
MAMTTRTNARIPTPLRELVDFLSGLESRAPVERLGQLLSDLQISPEELRPFMQFGEITYRRNLICEGDWFELLCICWKSGQRSPIHNHAGSTCGLRIIQGMATETTFAWSECGQIKAVKSVDYSPGDVCSTQDDQVHQVSNLQAEGHDLMTLHIYSPPLRKMDTYSLMGDVEVYTPTNFMVCQFADGI